MSTADQDNARFWDELCGTWLARALGIGEATPEALRRYDAAYFDLYPYLLRRVPIARLRRKRVLEVGLGWGSLGQKLFTVASEYVGLDVARAPVEMMAYRLKTSGRLGRAIQTSFLGNGLEAASFDNVVSIGCFHHTGDLAGCINETHRLLRPGGTAYVMVYNRFSLRQWRRWPRGTLLALLGRQAPSTEQQRAAYDTDSAGVAAPVTEYSSIRELRAMFGAFAHARFHKENCDGLRIGRLRVSRERLLRVVGPIAGLDIYIEARK